MSAYARFQCESLLPVSEINQRFRSGFSRTGGGLQAFAGLTQRSSTCASQLEATAR